MKTRQIATKSPPRETVELRKGLDAFLRQSLGIYTTDAPLGKNLAPISIGAVKWGVYAFFDYDGEPIYVGQTRESLATRIRRHLTNQRADAVAMSVLDPFEVKTIKVWPLPEFQDAKGKPSQSQAAREAADRLNALERTIFDQVVIQSKFGRILNEKDPPIVDACSPALEISGDIVGPAVLADREHPDVRIARRAMTISRLAQIISARSVNPGLRRALLTQATRLQFLADERFMAFGGDKSVEVRERDEPTELDLDDDEEA